MKAKHRTKRIQRYRKMLGIIVLMLTITLIGVVVSATVLYKRKNACKTPDTILVEYSKHFMQITWMDKTRWLRYLKYREMG